MRRHEITLLLKGAKESEKKYNWLDAVEVYRKASDWMLKEKDFLKAAEIRERMGFCFFRAAFQAETNRQFRSRMKLSVETYRKAAECLQKFEGEGKEAKTNHIKALVAYSSSWHETDPQKKVKFADEWWKLETQVLKAYEEAGDQLAVGKTINELLRGSEETRFWLTQGYSERQRMIEELLSFGEKAIMLLSEVSDYYELAWAYSYTAWYYTWGFFRRMLEDRREEVRKKCLNYSKKALELSEKTEDAYLIGRSNQAVGWATAICGGNSGIEFFQNVLKQGVIAKDNLLKGLGNVWISTSGWLVGSLEEDPDKKRKLLETALKSAQAGIRQFQIIAYPVPNPMAYRAKVESLMSLALIETNLEAKRGLLKRAVESGLEGLKCIEGVARSDAAPQILHGLGDAFYWLSVVETKVSEKRRFLEEALKYIEKGINILERTRVPSQIGPLGRLNNHRALILTGIAKLETDKTKKIELLNNAVSSIETGLKLTATHEKPTRIMSGWRGRFYYSFGRILDQLYVLTKNNSVIDKAIDVYKDAIELFRTAELETGAAESHWQIAKLYDKLGEHNEAARNYALASEEYNLAAEKIPQLKDFYQDYSFYMAAWGEIEKARYNHETEEYKQSRIHYEKAASLHESSKFWNYLAPNYSAWAKVEEAEALSREENLQEAMQAFQQAFEYFKKAEASFQGKIRVIQTAEEKEMVLKLVRASDLRRRYCQARISLEEAKILEKKGKYNPSSKSYGSAAEQLEKIIEEVESEQERKELKLIMTLCQAWQKMAMAEETTSSESYLEAAKLFEQAKDLSGTKKASLWALGNSSFCKGLAAGTRFQGSMDLRENAMAKRYMKSAASSYSQAGFKSASEYAKATQRLFDAYVFMNQAESEVDPEKKAKQYQMAENLLQISAGSFMKAKQPEKTAQVKQILKTVKEEKALAMSLNEVMHAPTITSSTLSFVAPTPTNEASVGLERFEHANVQANLIAGVRDVKVGESFCLSIEFVNAGKEPALLTRVEEFIPSDFIVVKKPEIYRLEDTCLNMKGRQIGPLKLVEAKLILQPSRKGVYQLKPRVHYLDELGQPRSLILKSVEIKVEEVLLEDRISTGTKELDSLLLGGIPEGYAVALTGPPSDERESLIRKFLKAGTKEDQITFYITTEAVVLENLLEKSGFYLFLCNPKPKTQVPDLPNVHKLRSKTDLTNLNIALTKAYRTIKQSKKGSRRACVEIVSDVLLRHGAEVTRRWISELITNMGSKGFTILGIMNPGMHPKDQATAVLDLFDGEISLFEIETATECKRSIRIKRLRNQDYIKNPICLTKPT